VPPERPQTSDGNNPVTAIIMLILGVGLIAGAELLRRRKISKG
jgi:hypothetical protein